MRRLTRPGVIIGPWLLLCVAAAIYLGSSSDAAPTNTSCTNGDGRGWGTGYEDARLQCFDTRPHGGPDTLWCVTVYRNGNGQTSCQWASAARR